MHPSIIIPAKDEKERLPESIKEAVDGYTYGHPIIKKILDKDGMRRWPAETDPAYLLRLWRYVQRYWTGNGGKWDGYPITSTAPYGVYNFEQKSLACPTSADMATALRSAGIPALEGQGWWLREDGGGCGGAGLRPEQPGLGETCTYSWNPTTSEKE